MKRRSRRCSAPRSWLISKSRRGRKRPRSRSRCGLKSSAAAHVVVAAAFDRAPRDRAADRAEHGAERLRIARCDDVAEHPAGDPADDQSGRAVVAAAIIFAVAPAIDAVVVRSEEHTSELQSLMRISYAVFCLKNN